MPDTNTLKVSVEILGDLLSENGFNFYSGVPCSFLKYLINYAINDRQFLMAANEGDAVAICAGAHLAGKKSVLLCQNSGLTNCVSPLTSLNHTFKIPVLGFVSLRGEQGLSDAPQHEFMGQITTQLLDLLQIKWEYLSTNPDQLKQQIKKANEFIENNKSFFFVVKKNSFAPVELQKQKIKKICNEEKIEKTKEDEMPKRFEVLQKISQLKNDKTVLLATTGFTGRELWQAKDDEQNFYMVGSMGCVSSIALGLSLNAKHKDVIAIDADGALLMRMGSLATNAYYANNNMLHILLDNNSHESTGGQQTVSCVVDFVNLAASVGYKKSIHVHNLQELQDAICSWQKNKNLTFLYLKICQGKLENLGRPDLKPRQIKERLVRFVDR